MDAPTQHRTLIVANLTASTPFLLQEVTRLAAERPTKFSLLVPGVDPAKSADGAQMPSCSTLFVIKAITSF